MSRIFDVFDVCGTVGRGTAAHASAVTRVQKPGCLHGSGAFGDVMLVRDTRSDKRFVLKRQRYGLAEFEFVDREVGTSHRQTCNGHNGTRPWPPPPLPCDFSTV